MSVILSIQIIKGAVVFSVYRANGIRKMVKTFENLTGQTRWFANGAVLIPTLFDAEEIVTDLAAVLKEFP